MPYRCLNCGCEFEEPETKNTSYEDYYGVGGMFPYHTPCTLYVCPCCEDEDIEEFDEDEEMEGEEEWQ
ncbi:hypothetical protein ACQQ4G_003108 [Listeria monocytogenes]